MTPLKCDEEKIMRGNVRSVRIRVSCAIPLRHMATVKKDRLYERFGELMKL